jgi:NitT/TauT family transport system substrate-binding protein
MPMIQTRRRFLMTLSLAAGAGLIPMRQGVAEEGALETTTVRFLKPGLCVSTLFVAEEFLRAEGFTDIRYVDAALGATGPVARDEVDCRRTPSAINQTRRASTRRVRGAAAPGPIPTP